MKRTAFIWLLSLGAICCIGCSQEKNDKDRSLAYDMFTRICNLTKESTILLSKVNDSVAWATACSDFEEKLDKISFSYPPDTDLLLTEGQNDTINTLLQEYIHMRDKRIHDILYPQIVVDTIVSLDSLKDVVNDKVSIPD